MTVSKLCKVCGNLHLVTITKEQYDKWQGGAHIQDAAPQLSADDRELLISGICGECFDKIFE